MKALLTIQSKLAVFSLCLAALHAHAFYNPTQGRWLNRDPIGETGGANLNLFCLNGPVDYFDGDGLAVNIIDHPPVMDADLGGDIARTRVIPEQEGDTETCGLWGNKYRLTGHKITLTITIFYASGVKPSDVVPRKTRTVQAHEMLHRSYWIEYFNAVDSPLSWMNGKCLSHCCYWATTDYVSKLADYMYVLTNYKNDQLDCDDYELNTALQQSKCRDARLWYGQLGTFRNQANTAFANAKTACGWK